MIKLIDFLLCAGTTAFELIAIILVALTIQCMSYRIFNFNIYQKLIEIVKE